MIAVIFEVLPTTDGYARYLTLAAELRCQLDEVDGFISIERFESLNVAGKIVSLSFWRDEDSLTKWRTHSKHRSAQSEGRGGLFSNYRLRVAGVVRDYGMYERMEAPTESF